MRQTALNQVLELARKDPRVVFIGSDLGVGTLADFKEEMPDRFFMEGIAEQNVIGMAAGLAMEGFIPYVNTIATFLTRRCFEQVAVDVCLHNLPVRLLASGGGVVYAPLGPTHLAIEDVGILRTLPNMTVVAPSDAHEMKKLIPQTLDYTGPIYIRFGKGGDPVVSGEWEAFQIGKALVKKVPGRVGLISTGVLTDQCLKAANALATKGITTGVLHCPTIKPLDDQAISEFARDVELLVTVEEHVPNGGLGSAVLDGLVRSGRFQLPRILRLSLPDCFPKMYGSQDDHLIKAGLDADSIMARVEAAT